MLNGEEHIDEVLLLVLAIHRLARLLVDEAVQKVVPSFPVLGGQAGEILVQVKSPQELGVVRHQQVMEQLVPALLPGEPARHSLAPDVVGEEAEELAQVHRRARGGGVPDPGERQAHLLLAGGAARADLSHGEEVSGDW